MQALLDKESNVCDKDLEEDRCLLLSPVTTAVAVLSRTDHSTPAVRRDATWLGCSSQSW
jgi:hypothetical protein